MHRTIYSVEQIKVTRSAVRERMRLRSISYEALLLSYVCGLVRLSLYSIVAKNESFLMDSYCIEDGVDSDWIYLFLLMI